MIPPTWMIEELERQRREREELRRPQPWLEVPPEPMIRQRPEPERDLPRGPVVIELW